ncbi:UbiA family prenyltransferase [Actinoplanes sp. RD1]|uniref:UbiA family prenyltransferase n=1 Tax=Actinoplanes sp. RD1 TaxID=3064538 RepID=UPI002740B712|nr:UbiA family prenyltransferase [Actinoplanes sp. RD1]
MLQQISERIVKGSPDSVRDYLLLARLHKPTGVILYLLPGWWSFALASGRRPDLVAMLCLAVAAVLVRGAACAFNDVIDRDIDAQVARTASRPVAAGKVSIRNALLFAAAQALLALLVLLPVNVATAVIVGASFPLLVAYPYMKRIFFWPSAFLALVINVYALAGWTAVTGRLEVSATALGLYACGFFWTLIHDTIYSHQDKEYDRSIGVKSSALIFGAASKAWLLVFLALSVGSALWAGAQAPTGWAFFPLTVAAGLLLGYQIVRVDLDDPQSCWDTFKANVSFGWLVLAAAVAGIFT